MECSYSFISLKLARPSCCNPCYNGILLQRTPTWKTVADSCNPCYNGILLQPLVLL